MSVFNYENGAGAALLKLGVAKDFSDVHAKLRELSKPTLFNRFEGLFTGKPDRTKTDPNADATVKTLRDQLRKKYNITPRLTGSMPLGLALPGDTDIDFYVRTQSPAKFNKLVSKLHKSDFKPSPYNKPGAGYHVFQRPGDLPIDLAVAHGTSGKAYADSLKKKQEIADSLPTDLREAILAKKHTLKHTLFDTNHKRYKDFKRELEQHMGGYRLKRAPLETPKTAALVDLHDPAQLDKFNKFVNDDNLFGHRTHNLDSVLNSGHLSAALDSLRRKQLKSYEAGSSQGTHTAMPYQDLAPEHIAQLEKSLLTNTPDTSVYDTLATQTGLSADQVKANFLRQRFNKVRQFVRTQENPEAFREANLAVPKLGPNIFVTKGGVLDTPAYGNASLLFHTQHAAPSPYMNLVRDEYIVPPKDVMTPRAVPVRHGYAVLPKADIGQYEKTHPEMRYVAQEDLPDDLRSRLFKPTHDIKETWERWLPAAMQGNLHVLENR